MRIEPVARFREATFDLTPMIDVVLLLIIFFSMTSQFSQMENRPMDLPQERGQGVGQYDAAFSVVVDMERDGALSVRGKPCTQAELAALLKDQARAAPPTEASQGRSSLEVVVRADRHCMTEHLEQLGRSLADAGIVNWKLATAGTGG